MKKLLVTLFAAATVLVAGCVHLPSIYGPTPATIGNKSVAPVSQVTKQPTAKQAVQTAFNWFATICVIGGLVSIGLGAFSIYRGLIVSGIKFLLGGVLVPVAGIYLAYHWAIIVGLCLIGAGAYLTVTYWSAVTPWLTKVEADIHPLFIKLGVVKAPVVPAIVSPVIPVPTANPAAK